MRLPRARRSCIACTAAKSAGVPPKAAAPLTWLMRCAPVLATPFTAHDLGVVALVVVSTPGWIKQDPARRSVPNQLTTSDTLSRLGATCSRLSSEAGRSALPKVLFWFSGMEVAPEERVIVSVA